MKPSSYIVLGKPKVIAVVGPTSSGKTALGIVLAQKFDGEIISADSRQVYKGLNLGTGKVTKKEMAGVKHHLLDVVSPKKQFSVDDFVIYGQKALSHILENKRIPIIVGGTGLYIDALLGRIVIPTVPPNPQLRKLLEKKTIAQLYTDLQMRDPARAATIEPHHKRRIIRALEIATALGRSPTLAEVTREPEYNILWIGLKPSEKKLKERIRVRLLARIRAGMVREGEKLHRQGLSYKRMDELGLEYKFMSRLLQKQITRHQFEEELERAIWHYAKRQMRWFNRNPNIVWVRSNAQALRLAKKFIAKSKSPQRSSGRPRSR